MWIFICRVNTLRPGQNGRHFADDIFKCIFVNENVWIPIKISLKFVPKGPNNNIPALVQIMAWRRPGDKALSEPMMVRLPTHICVTRPRWVNNLMYFSSWIQITQAAIRYHCFPIVKSLCLSGLIITKIPWEWIWFYQNCFCRFGWLLQFPCS